MKIIYLYFIVFQVFLSDVNGYHHKRQASHHGHSKHYDVYTNVKMPSGKIYSVIKPQGSKKVCKQESWLVEMRSTDKRWKFEYNLMQKEFNIGNQNGIQAKVIRVQKVFNPCLWSAYIYRQDQIREHTNTMNEMMLYHQSDVAHLLALGGFDERKARKDGRFGAGIYFSDVIKHLMCKQGKNGQYCQSLLSRVTLGKIHIQFSPKYFDNPPVGTHSVQGVNPLRRGYEYVIYRGEQAYPEYLITFKLGNQSISKNSVH